MTDPTGTTRTPFAASWDGESYYTGNTHAGAVARAVDAWIESLGWEVDCPEDWPHDLDIEVCADCLWCPGPAPGAEACHCEGQHEDDAWELLSCRSRETITETVEEPDAG